MKKQKKQELTEEQKSELLHKLLFKDKVEKLGNRGWKQVRRNRNGVGSFTTGFGYDDI